MMKVMKHSLAKFSLVLLSINVLTACQSLKTQPTIQAIPVVENIPLPKNFNINGKIGLTTPQQAGSAFYVWSQKDDNFAIELAGALNAGQTNISYNGKTATLTTNKGEMTAENPDELLFKATGWQAPISQLPYWIMGQSAPSDENVVFDENKRLSQSQNADWVANFSYKNAETLPQKLTINHPDGYKVVLTINHLPQ